MFSNTLKRSVATLSIMAGLLAAAGPAGAQGGGADFPSTNKPLAVTMLDYMGSPLFDNTPLDEVVFSATISSISGAAASSSAMRRSICSR